MGPGSSGNVTALTTPPSSEPEPSVGICICAMDRPEALQTCLQSIAEGDLLPAQVIVSDDSRNSQAVRDMCARFPFVEYQQGPRRGLCANRNQVIAAARTSHIALLDDDAAVSADFVSRALEHARNDDAYTIISGDVLDGGQVFEPGSADFWGRFLQTPRGDRYETIQLNCNLFPRHAFEVASFDELIVYGFEDMDLCNALLVAGFRIEHDPALQNQHFPPPQDQRTSRKRFRQWEEARYFCSLKRFFVWEQSPVRGLVYIFAAPIHTAVFSARWRQWHRLPEIPGMMFRALRGFFRFRRAGSHR